MSDPLLKHTITLILAGGQGERLYPLTRDRAKPAVPFGAMYRIIDYTLSNCLNSGCQHLYVLTQYKSFSLDRHLILGWSGLFNNPEMGNYMHILPPQQRTGQAWYLGTADAIYQNVYTLEREKPQRVLILAGDHIYKMNYADMVRYHVEREADLTISCVQVDKSEASQLGIAVVDSQNRIQAFQEKPRENPATLPNDPEHCFASMGIYVFNTDVLVRRVAADARKQNSAHDFGKNIIPEMVSENMRVYAYPFKDENRKNVAYWRDVGAIDSYYAANMELVQVNPLFNLYDENWPIRTYREQFPPAKFVFAESATDPNARRGQALDSLVSPGVVVSGGTVERSLLAPQVRINSYSHVEDSILMEGVNIGRRAKVRKAIIDKGVRIPEGATIGYDREADSARFTVTAEGVVVVPKEMPLE